MNNGLKSILRYLTLCILLGGIGTISYGFICETELSNPSFYKGIGTVLIFFVSMPLFLLIESRGKKMNDYMLTEENLKRMRNSSKKN